MVWIGHVRRLDIREFQSGLLQGPPKAAPAAVAGAIHADLDAFQVLEFPVAATFNVALGNQAFVDAVSGL